ncbi:MULTISPECIES: transcriptional repressor [Shewanella]|jgi:Fur family ferric uptake transcriptional regulator|uniref:Ferric uptake regulation protein n=1 Tax=Shewanella psychromarinicola TaxID=2487742 RepID=A0A3N4E050_9GAMM|nr:MULTISPECIES: transcriptional repressor [Shewanella]AZG33692.1 transcriptional repressor [Shewanella psychromarinicola]MCL1083435.1 transcriptional repressor [Shewanella psychromarinicola]PKG78743.1 transcriptional repressor [Shewanella sp. Actino-trap-3]RPA23064.1 transcriptional repressor [Shewanella psychromarinicola]|tara:strand:+ start:80371 stop:80814 length:444 start_codon:yes stop_codon:yes gene_type:complete
MQAVLKDSGLKITTQRCKLLEFLTQVDEQHLTVENIYQGLNAQGETIGLNTVYRIMAHFEQAGIVVRRLFESENAVYELNNKPRHDHLICLTCGKLTEFTDPLIELRLGLAAEHHGMIIHHHSLNMYGHCFDCQQALNSQSARQKVD